jgi:hypothetical protein
LTNNFLQVATVAVYNSAGAQMAINSNTDLVVSSQNSTSTAKEFALDSDSQTYFSSEGTPDQFLGIRLGSFSVSKVTIFTRQDIYYYRWFNCNISLLTNTLSSTTSIPSYYPLMNFSFYYSGNGLSNVMTDKHNSSVIIPFTNPATALNSTYFMLGPQTFRNTFNGDLYYVLNNSIKNYPLYIYASNGFGEVYELSNTDLLSRIVLNGNVTYTGVSSSYFFILLVNFILMVTNRIPPPSTFCK